MTTVVLSDGTTPQAPYDIGTLLAPTISPRIPTVVATSLTYGTDKTPVATETYFAEISIPANVTLTGIEALIGSVGGTDKFVFALYSSTGAVVANTAVAGVTVGTTATFQRIAFTTPYQAKGPAQFFVGVQVNGTTARLRTIPVGPTLACGKKTGETFGTLTTITPPTTFTADLGPVANTY